MAAGGVTTVATGGGQSMQMGSLGVLDFGGFHRDAIVDHWDVLGSVPGTTAAVSVVGNWGRSTVVMVVVVAMSWSVSGAGVGLSVSGSVEGLSVLDFGGFYRDALVDHRIVQGSVPLGGVVMIPVSCSMAMTMDSGGGMGSKVGSLGCGNLGSISRNVASASRSEQKNGSYHKGFHYFLNDHCWVLRNDRDTGTWLVG